MVKQLHSVLYLLLKLNMHFLEKSSSFNQWEMLPSIYSVLNYTYYKSHNFMTDHKRNAFIF